MGKYFPFFFLLFPAICCAGILQERGFREALTPSPSFRQSEGEVKWDKQPESELDLGKAYYYGRGTKKNFKKARKHLQKAADAGEREAQLILALMQVQGQGIEENPQAGFEAVQKLAPDYPLAQYALARLYADGLGTPANAEKALKWLTRAAQAPVPVPAAQVKLGNYYAEGYPPYIKPDAEKAFELTLAAAEAENRAARYRVALMYLNGQGTEKNEKRAFHFMRLSARDGLIQAQKALSGMYRNGTGVAQDDYGVFSWMLAAAKNGDAEAQEQTALHYLHGTGVAASRKEALFWAVRAQQNGGKNAAEIIRRIKEDQ